MACYIGSLLHAHVKFATELRVPNSEKFFHFFADFYEKIGQNKHNLMANDDR